jgi:hypothetical protein
MGQADKSVARVSADSHEGSMRSKCGIHMPFCWDILVRWGVRRALTPGGVRRITTAMLWVGFGLDTASRRWERQ